MAKRKKGKNDFGEDLVLCPECKSERVHTAAVSRYYVNTGDHFCHPLRNIAEWRKGCSCSVTEPGECLDCTNGLVDAIEQWFKVESPGVLYAYRRRGLDEFVTCTSQRFWELQGKPELFEVRILYTHPLPSKQVSDTEAPTRDQ